MSISPAHMDPQLPSVESPALTKPSAPASVPADAPAAESPAEAPAPAPAAPPPTQFSTDLQVDSQHQIYYEVVNESTGNVLFEIPAAAMREIGESINVSQAGGANGHLVDVDT